MKLEILKTIIFMIQIKFIIAVKKIQLDQVLILTRIITILKIIMKIKISIIILIIIEDLKVMLTVLNVFLENVFSNNANGKILFYI